MDNIHIRIMYQIPEIMISLKSLAEFLPAEFHPFAQMSGIHIANSDQTASPVAGKMVGRTSDSAHSYDSFCKLVARSDISLVSSHSAEHMSGKNRKQGDSGPGLLQETSSGFIHSSYDFKGKANRVPEWQAMNGFRSETLKLINLNQPQRPVTAVCLRNCPAHRFPRGSRPCILSRCYRYTPFHTRISHSGPYVFQTDTPYSPSQTATP